MTDTSRWKFEVTDEQPLPKRARDDEFGPIRVAIRELPIGKWLVVRGFRDDKEITRTQSAVVGSLAIELAAAGYKIKTRRNTRNGALELWICKQSKTQDEQP
jgi:hypothetical protein